MNQSDLNKTSAAADCNQKSNDSMQNDSGVFDETFKSQPAAQHDSPNMAVSADEQKLVDYAKSQFNINRKVIIRNTPQCTYNDVKTFLGKYAVKNILISKKQRHAVVWLTDGAQAEEVCRALNNKSILGQRVEVSLFRNENFLCVAHLPLNITDTDFRGLVSELGLTERVFLMRDQKGRSKGYGFVEYSHNYQKTKQACGLLDGKRMGSCTLQCEFVEESVLTFTQLNSKCLFVDHLPPNYTDFGGFSKIFSRVHKPLYCRLGMENERALGFGIVEYQGYEEAEMEFFRLHSTAINNHTIRVTHCIPGISATQVYEKQSKSLESQKLPKFAGLLPDPMCRPTPSLLGLPDEALANPVMKSLLSGNPKVLENFQSVLSRLQQQTMKHQDAGKPGMLGPGPDAKHNPLLDPRLQVAILACVMAQQLEENQPAIFQNPVVDQFLKSNTLDAEKPSLLGNPVLAQANRMLVNLNQIEGKDTKTDQQKPESSNAGPSGDVPNALVDFKSMLSAMDKDPEANAQDSPKVGLLGDAPPGHAPLPASSTVQSTHQKKSEESFGNPVLALIIEAQIHQQLQTMQAWSILSSVGGGSGSFGGSEGRAPLLGNAPAGQMQHGGPSGVEGQHQGRRRGLMGDAPPGQLPLDDRDSYFHGGRGRGNYQGRGRGRGFDNTRRSQTQGDWREDQKDNYNQMQGSFHQNMSGGHQQPQQNTGDQSAMYQQMYQMYQQYLTEFSKLQQQQNNAGNMTSQADQMVDDDSSDAVYSSGIANQPAFSTGMSYGDDKAIDPAASALPLAAFFSQLSQFGNQLPNMLSSGAQSTTSGRSFRGGSSGRRPRRLPNIRGPAADRPPYVSKATPPDADVESTPSNVRQNNGNSRPAPLLPDPDQFHGNGPNGGPNQGNRAPAQGNVGPGQGNVGRGQGNVGPGQGNVGHGQGNVGSGQGNVGRGQGNVGPGQGNVGRGQDNVGSSYGDAGSGQGNYGSNRGNSGLNQTSYSLNRKNSDPNSGMFGSKSNPSSNQGQSQSDNSSLLGKPGPLLPDPVARTTGWDQFQGPGNPSQMLNPDYSMHDKRPSSDSLLPSKPKPLLDFHGRSESPREHGTNQPNQTFNPNQGSSNRSDHSQHYSGSSVSSQLNVPISNASVRPPLLPMSSQPQILNPNRMDQEYDTFRSNQQESSGNFSRMKRPHSPSPPIPPPFPLLPTDAYNTRPTDSYGQSRAQDNRDSSSYEARPTNSFGLKPMESISSNTYGDESMHVSGNRSSDRYGRNQMDNYGGATNPFSEASGDRLSEKPTNPFHKISGNTFGEKPQENFGTRSSDGYVDSYTQRKPEDYGVQQPHSYSQRKPDNYGGQQRDSYSQRKPDDYGGQQSSSYAQRKPEDYGVQQQPDSYAQRKPDIYSSQQSSSYSQRKPEDYGVQQQPDSYAQRKPDIHGGQQSDTGSFAQRKPDEYGSKPNSKYSNYGNEQTESYSSGQTENYLGGTSTNYGSGHTESYGTRSTDSYGPGFSGNYVSRPSDSYVQSSYGAHKSTTSDFNPVVASTPVSHNKVIKPPTMLAHPVTRDLKRQHLLPSPEQSPEGDYIGQHSQGIGGHYASSYKRRKL